MPQPGTAVTAFIQVPSAQQRYSVPADAIQLVNGAAVVFRYQRGAVEAVPVVVGRQSAERVEILQGVRSGDLLLSGNTASLRSAVVRP
jgi:cobalt-zinc-cadmium efflux system membrane fusion protein